MESISTPSNTIDNRINLCHPHAFSWGYIEVKVVNSEHTMRAYTEMCISRQIKKQNNTDPFVCMEI